MADTGMVFVVDDDASMCELIETALRRAGLQVRTFPSAEAFKEAKARKDCHSSSCCLLLDLVLPGQSGLVFLDKHFNRLPCPVIIITSHGSIQDAVKAMKLGAVDFLEKPFSTEALKEMVFETLKCHRDTGLMVRRRLATLTSRERETLDAIVQGESNKVVADRLGISFRTVDKHRAHLMNRMRAINVADLVRMVIQAGI
jgi:FixJ family two-component response regulator